MDSLCTNDGCLKIFNSVTVLKNCLPRMTEKSFIHSHHRHAINMKPCVTEITNDWFHWPCFIFSFLFIHFSCFFVFLSCSALQIFQQESHPSVYKSGLNSSKEGLSLFGKHFSFFLLLCSFIISISFFLMFAQKKYLSVGGK